MADDALVDTAPETRRANLLALFDTRILSQEEFEAESALIDCERTNASDGDVPARDALCERPIHRRSVPG